MKMKRLLLMCAAILTASLLHAGDSITVKAFTDGDFAAKRISGMRPIGNTSEYAQISQDGKQVVAYSFKTGRQTRVVFDIADTKGEKISEFDDYEMTADGKFLLIETNRKGIYRRSFTADYYIYNVGNKSLKKLSENGAEQIPTFSPDGKKIAFVRKNNIFIVDKDGEHQITADGEVNKVINGLPDWVNEEEFSFNDALAWGADSKTLSWIRYNESNVKTYSLQLFKGEEPERKEFSDYPGLYSYKYPKAGQENSKVSAWCYNLTTGKTIGYKLPLPVDGYIPRIKQTGDVGRIILFTMNRHQDDLKIYSANPMTGECRLLIEETNPKYVKEEAMEGIIIGEKQIVLPSDRDGIMSLYLYGSDGKLIKKLPSKREITAVYGYDEKEGKAYVQTVGATPMDRMISIVGLNSVKNLTKDTGWNTAGFSGDYQYFLNAYSDINHPYIYSIVDNNGKVVREVLNNDELVGKLKKFNLRPREFFKFRTSEGVELNGWIVKPTDFDASKKYPVVMFQYSGPGNQQVINNWGAGSMGNGGLFDYYFAQHGYIVVCVDGRGTGGRGADFEKCTYLKIGDLESRDQVETALWLGKQSYVDSTRIGIWGWSFGGFNTLMSMSEGRPVFKAGVAVAPPTNWKFYDTIYTERYMRTPEENPYGYALNPISRAKALHGKLLICHGVADDNVHPQNTFEYAEALIQADKDFKENYYTNRNHSIYGGNTRNHLLRQISEWFFENL